MRKSLFEKGCLGHVPVSYGGVRGREADFWRNAEIERKTHGLVSSYGESRLSIVVIKAGDLLAAAELAE